MTHDKRMTFIIHMYAVQSEVGKKLLGMGTKLLNNVPDNMKQITPQSLFKYRLKCYMLQSLEP